METMKTLSEKTGFTTDREEDNRLLDDDNQIIVSAYEMGKSAYEEMEKDINEFEIKRDKYVVYGSNDCSGFDYWNRDDEYNYIMLTARIDNLDMSETDIQNLMKDMEYLYFHFQHYGIR